MSETAAKPRTRARPADAAPAETDGRTERSARTRERIVSAVLDLIRAGNLNPTSEEVALYAGVGHRTVFRHFQDMESLFDEMNGKVRHLAHDGFAAVRPEGTLAERIGALVEGRARTFELITMYYMSGELRTHNSPTLRRARAQFARRQRDQLLEILPEAGASAEIAAAADLLTSMDGWLRLRRVQRLSIEQARRCLADSLSRLLQA